MFKFDRSCQKKARKIVILKCYNLPQPSANKFEKIKESDDNNNVVLRGVIDKIENIEAALDEKLNGKTEFKIEDEEEYKTFKDKYNG